MNRRKFIQQTALVAAGAATFNFTAEAKVDWPVGCFNRPWTKWSFDETLKQIKAAGYKSTGLLSRTKDEPFIGVNATPEYLESLKKRIGESGLMANMGALGSRHNIPLEDSIKEVRKQIDNAEFLSLKYVLSFGADNPEQFAHYFKVMSDAAAYAQEKGIKLTMKPHGGISGSSEEILRVIKEVNHKNFSIWYDAGNIIYYTGKDPVAEIEPIARHITGFCAKDCGELKGDVMLQFGAGKVDFEAVFKKLKAGGFDGPVMVECCKIGATPEETMANARANREFLEK
ncbi:MAG TPA: sugar phosphate isomerase/epimerase family protein, partial [Blastocatellia bacterium]|nr:sugar phosphate isomerase/epimerase family protein [Blastocatellia bacterium]